MKMIYSVVRYDKVLLAFSNKKNAEQYAEQQNAKVQPTLFVDFYNWPTVEGAFEEQARKEAPNA